MTTPTHDDDQLRRLFAELKAADQRRLTPFETVLGAARARGSARRAGRPRRTGLALALVAAAAGAVILFRPRPPRVEPVALGSWQSPTAALLRTPGEAILTSVPSLASSVVHTEPAPTVPTPSPDNE